MSVNYDPECGILFVAILRHRERQRFDMQCGFYVMCQICELLRAL